MKTFGLIGKNIAYSFSRNYFKTKFESENIPAVYKNFDLDNIEEFPELISENTEIKGLNVTIPYKETIIPFLDNLDPIAREIGAVNTIKIEDSGKLIGYNTDYYGFLETLKPHLKKQHTHALILGKGGASKAIAYALKELDIDFKFVSRSPLAEDLSYTELNKSHFDKYKLIINCTPLGTHPQTEEFPPIPTSCFTSDHLLFDLIYNPPITKLMKLALENDAKAVNGQRMLELQAEKAWEIWNK
ncbi:MAG TPA: shikimate dehydrogenase [Gillisia sp.]|nr:shikimate dehydrogenase [Gillisia sp.]